MSRSKLSEERSKLINKLQALLQAKVRAAQARLYSRLFEWSQGLDADNGLITFSQQNFNQINQIITINQGIVKKEGGGLAKWIGNKVMSLFNLNQRYFRSFVSYDFETVDARAREKTLFRLGYDASKKQIVKGGYLWEVANTMNISQTIGEKVNNAMAARIGLKEFRQQLKADFVNPSGLGMLERHFYTKTFDIFQQQDRAITKDYSDELNLDYFIYSGTEMSRTRPFCEERVGKIFTRAEVESWRNQVWEGKNKNYDPFLDCGGYNCRHKLDAIDAATAEFIRKRR